LELFNIIQVIQAAKLLYESFSMALLTGYTTKENQLKYTLLLNNETTRKGSCGSPL